MTGTIFTVAQLSALSTMLVLLVQKRRRDRSASDPTHGGDVGHDADPAPEYGHTDGRPLAL